MEKALSIAATAVDIPRFRRVVSSESSEALCRVDDLPLKVVFARKLTLRTAHGEVTEVAAKGVTAPYAAAIRFALQHNLLVHSARLHLPYAEQTFEVTLDAERFDLRAAKVPKLLDAGDEGEDVTERLELVGRLS